MPSGAYNSKIYGLLNLSKISCRSATALFYCLFASDPKASDMTTVQSVQLDRPVLDFTVDESGRIWALVDGEWEAKEEHGGQRLVRLLDWSDGKV